MLETVLVSTAFKTIGLVGSTLWLIPLLLTSVSYFRYDRLDPESHPLETKDLLAEYDFVVIGGGSAGAVVASRLSEVEGWRVLLLEAGRDENEISDIPSLSAYLQLTDMDWKYRTQPTGVYSK